MCSITQMPARAFVPFGMSCAAYHKSIALKCFGEISATAKTVFGHGEPARTDNCPGNLLVARHRPRQIMSPRQVYFCVGALPRISRSEPKTISQGFRPPSLPDRHFRTLGSEMPH
jgi:hypothetical protein